MVAWADSHLLSSKNQTLLHGWDALLLLDLLLDRGDLVEATMIRVCPQKERGGESCRGRGANLVVPLDVEFDLLACQCSDPGGGTVSQSVIPRPPAFWGARRT